MMIVIFQTRSFQWASPSPSPRASPSPSWASRPAACWTRPRPRRPEQVPGLGLGLSNLSISFSLLLYNSQHPAMSWGISLSGGHITQLQTLFRFNSL